MLRLQLGAVTGNVHVTIVNSSVTIAFLRMTVAISVLRLLFPHRDYYFCATISNSVLRFPSKCCDCRVHTTLIVMLRKKFSYYNSYLHITFANPYYDSCLHVTIDISDHNFWYRITIAISVLPLLSPCYDSLSRFATNIPVTITITALQLPFPCYDCYIYID